MSTVAQQILAGRQVFARLLAAEAVALSNAARVLLEPQLDAEEAVAARLPDGTRIGKVARSKPALTARVTDEAALLAWVKATTRSHSNRAAAITGCPVRGDRPISWPTVMR